MERIIIKANATEEWHSLVCEAENASGKHVTEQIESYLVFLLQRFTNRPEIAANTIALIYLQSQQLNGELKIELLRDVGDQCLLFSGLFPERATKLALPVSYFVELGKRAYDTVGTLYQRRPLIAELYQELQQQFIELMDILQYMREITGEHSTLSLLQAEELWRNTGSKHALAVIRQVSKGTLVFGKSWDDEAHYH